MERAKMSTTLAVSEKVAAVMKSKGWAKQTDSAAGFARQRTLNLTKNRCREKVLVALCYWCWCSAWWPTSGCARRTAQQKKTSWYKQHSRRQSVPCPCDH